MDAKKRQQKAWNILLSSLSAYASARTSASGTDDATRELSVALDEFEKVLDALEEQKKGDLTGLEIDFDET